ncbi:OsmC family protein [Demequina sp. SYSU T00039]|uniref:OsmC family protein n=1 Tax=Demequina lignilytica TaxID=3051663 RepID=A0AAW7M8R7_9MICO|nr:MULTISPECIES: OsmC family protein [unclassified Demequina]MDN4477737.1 OsmC family protein [Demequina sp. SYSU T00039-1]MDN4487646.1 OsmC family protein [Demequina sp. SYSU T00039]MDN4491357.1 OsmC family protein [Demequina sp. SYSU T00068]
MTREATPRTVTLARESEGVYIATNAKGHELRFGRGEGLLSPVELLLAAIAGCSSIDVDKMTSRRAEPERFDVTATADYVTEDGANILENIQVLFDLAFPAGEDGDAARKRVGAALRASHERHCTVSRTVEAGVPVALVEAPAAE